MCLVKAYYQIHVAEEDIKKTGITSSFGLHDFPGTPSGLRNDKQSFIDEVLRGLSFVFAYIDYVPINRRDRKKTRTIYRKLSRDLNISV